MKINNDLSKRGNEWIPRFLLIEETSEFVEFQQVPKQPAEIIAVFKTYPNAESKQLGVGSRIVNVNYRRLDLKQLFVKFDYKDRDDFFEKALAEINLAITKLHGDNYTIELDDVDLEKCNYDFYMSRIAVKQNCPFWFDFCLITNSIV